MRPDSPYRRHSAIALVFAAWCAAYGVPAELVRSLGAHSAGLSQLNAVRPGKQAKVLLGRLSAQARRAEQPPAAPFAAVSDLAVPTQLLPCSPLKAIRRPAPQPASRSIETLFERPPPVSLPA